MAGRLPQISMEPAPGFLPFVETHLATLRRDAHRLTGDGTAAEEVSSGVLTDVAVRWFWFELLRVRLGRRDPARAFLNVALTRRCVRRLPDPDDGYTGPAVQVRSADATRPAGWPSSAASGWFPESDLTGVVQAPTTGGRQEHDSPIPTMSSAAVRIAKVGVAPPPTPSAVLEAVIAWIHAYKTYQRWRRIAAVVLTMIVLVVLVRLRGASAAF
jgi:hypothetical protein